MLPSGCLSKWLPSGCLSKWLQLAATGCQVAAKRLPSGCLSKWLPSGWKWRLRLAATGCQVVGKWLQVAASGCRVAAWASAASGCQVAALVSGCQVAAGTCATSWTEGVYWSPRRGLFPSSSGHKRGSLGFALPLLRGKDLFITKCVAGTMHSLDCFFPWRSTSSVYHESRIPVAWSLGQAISSLSLMSWSLSASGPICPAGRHCHGDYRAAASFALPRT